jgi:hypothetical protein
MILRRLRGELGRVFDAAKKLARLGGLEVVRGRRLGHWMRLAPGKAYAKGRTDGLSFAPTFM